jgi:hypothetical protein
LISERIEKGKESLGFVCRKRCRFLGLIGMIGYWGIVFRVMEATPRERLVRQGMHEGYARIMGCGSKGRKR